MTTEDLQQEQGQVTEAETKARAQGWVPKEEFRGNEAAWVTAEEFVVRGEQINPILRKNNERIQRELDKTKEQMEELRAATEEFKKFQKEAFDRKVEKYKEEIADLREAKKAAITAGDGDLVVAIDEKIDAVKESQAQAKVDAEAAAKKKDTKEESKTTPPEVEAWVEKNPWFKTDISMQRVTNSLASGIREDYPSLKGEKFFEELDRKLEEAFSPEKLGKKTKPRNPVEGSKPRGGDSKNDKGYDSLPPEAKAACDKFVKQKILTREQYVADYYA